MPEGTRHSGVRRCVVLSGLFLAFLCLSSFARAQTPQHGIALHGRLKYGPDFTHFDYAAPNAPKGGTLTLGATGSFDTLNPFVLKGVPAAGADLPFETLMEGALDEPFSQYGRIAKSVALFDGGVIFALRPEARFNDKTPVRPEDVVFSFEILRDKGHPFYRSYYKDVARATPTGPHEVTFFFSSTNNAELPLILGQMPILSKHDWEGKNFDATTLSPPLGSGPYEVEKITAGRFVTYRRVKDWWGKDLPVNKGRYNFERIVYDYYRDATVALEAFFAGRIDLRAENSAKNWATAYDSPSVKSGLIVRQEIRNELPAGMQAFVFNTRRPLFKDPRVRRALALAFDFDWSNKNIAFGAYTRTNSYFANSELAARGLPSPKEMKLLEPLRDKVPPEVFTDVYEAPKTDGSGRLRENLRVAAELLQKAGWSLKDGKLLDGSGAVFAFEIVDSSPLFERWVLPFVKNLKRLGISARFRVVDSAQYQNLINDFNFDMIVHVFGQSLSPGNEQRDFWESEKAETKGSRNLIGVRNEAVDALIERIVAAKNREDLIAACRALDRVLLWNHYVIPHWNLGTWRLAYWDKFGQPSVAPPYGLRIDELWWVDPEKEKALSKARAR